MYKVRAQKNYSNTGRQCTILYILGQIHIIEHTFEGINRFFQFFFLQLFHSFSPFFHLFSLLSVLAINLFCYQFRKVNAKVREGPRSQGPHANGKSLTLLVWLPRPPPTKTLQFQNIKFFFSSYFFSIPNKQTSINQLYGWPLITIRWPLNVKEYIRRYSLCATEPGV